jgi:hypothetical protein
MAFKNDPISTDLDSVKAILTFSILFWSMSILFTVLKGRIRIRNTDYNPLCRNTVCPEKLQNYIQVSLLMVTFDSTEKHNIRSRSGSQNLYFF